MSFGGEIAESALAAMDLGMTEEQWLSLAPQEPAAQAMAKEFWGHVRIARRSLVIHGLRKEPLPPMTKAQFEEFKKNLPDGP